MKTKETIAMENALLAKELAAGNPIATEVPYYKTVLHCGYYHPEGRMQYIDAVSYSLAHFTCYELKVSMSDLHSKAAQSFVGSRNFLVCPEKMAKEILEKKDHWLEEHKDVGIMAWDGKSKFKIVKLSKINYDLPINDWRSLALHLMKRMATTISQQTA